MGVCMCVHIYVHVYYPSIEATSNKIVALMSKKIAISRVSYSIFWGGGEKKMTQGYSWQHLIKSLTPSNAHCD